MRPSGVLVKLAYASAQTGDAATVYAWNEILLEAFRLEGGGPGPLARAAAMMHVGIYDVLNSVYWSHSEATGSGAAQACGWEPYLVLARVDPGLDADLAAGYAARAILSAVLPDRAAFVASEFDARHPGAFDADAYALGSFAAQAILAARHDDGADDDTPYTPDPDVGAWQPTGHLCETAADAVTPNWGRLRPFTMTASDQFRRTTGPLGFDEYEDLLASEDYADQLAEVQDLGNADGNASSRTPEQEEIAWFWANDLDGTYKPPGQLLDHAREAAQTQGAAATSGDPDTFDGDWSQQGVRVARLFARTALALADAGIAAWDQKYETDVDLWRPQTAIRNADLDGNTETVEDENWTPLSADEQDESFNPCFPAWVSGHATFAGAWAGVMSAEPFDEGPLFPLTLGTEDPHAENVELDYDSFDDAAEENARSRIYLGVHFQVDADDGLATGDDVAGHVAGSTLRWNEPCPTHPDPCTQPIATPSDRLDAGQLHSVAVNPDGTVLAWGWNHFGQLGDGTTTDRHEPVQVSGLTDVVSVASAGDHNLALRADGTVWSWGSNFWGQLGDGVTGETHYGYSDVPVQAAGIDDIVAIATGAAGHGDGGHSVALGADGTLWMWGLRPDIQSSVPAAVTGISDVAAIASGVSHSLFLLADGTVLAWGANYNGELGDGTTTQREDPVQVTNLTDVVAIDTKGAHSLALRSDGTVWAWGWNGHGQLGDGTTTLRTAPVQVSTLTDVVAIRAGAAHSVAVTEDGTVWAWGANASGQLGDGTTTDRDEPVPVSSLTDVAGIAAGDAHTLAVDTSPATWAWGANASGQLGDGTTTDRDEPVAVSGL